MKLSTTVNGQPLEHDVEARTLLAMFLREQLGLTGTKIGCDTTSCAEDGLGTATNMAVAKASPASTRFQDILLSPPPQV